MKRNSSIKNIGELKNLFSQSKEIDKTQYLEGKLAGCGRYKCNFSCCDDGLVMEWVNEYFLFHERLKDNITNWGIKIIFKDDRVIFENCSDGKNCKFLKYSSNKDIDLRPIDCKIYPYVVDWEDINFDDKIVKLFYWDKDCPLVKNNAITKEFKNEVEMIIKRDFAVLFYGAQFKIEFLDKVKRN